MATGNYGNYGTAPGGFPANGATGTWNTFAQSNPPGFGQQAWGSTFLGDLFARPDFKATVLEEYFYRSGFVNSGIIQRNTQLDLRAGGVVVEMPYFKPFDPFEEYIESNATWGASGAGHLTPQKIGTDSFRVPVVHRGFAAAADDLSRLGSGEDPLAAIRSYIANAMTKFRHQHLIALLNGMFDATNGALKSNFIGAAGKIDFGNLAYFNAAQVIEGQNVLGERGDQLTTIAMHSAVRNHLMHMGLLTFSSPAGVTTGSNISWQGGGVGVSDESVEYFAGKRIVVDDRLTPRALSVGNDVAANAPQAGDPVPAIYPVYMFGQGVIQEGIQQDFRIANERNILSMQDIMACDWHYAMGIAGIDYNGSNTAPTPAAMGGGAAFNVAGGPRGAGNLAPSGTYPLPATVADPVNYSLKWDARTIPVVKLEVLTPFGEQLNAVA